MKNLLFGITVVVDFDYVPRGWLIDLNNFFMPFVLTLSNFLLFSLEWDGWLSCIEGGFFFFGREKLREGGGSMSRNTSDFSKKRECKFCFLPFCSDFWKLFKIYVVNSTYFISHLFHQVFKYLYTMSSGSSKKSLPISKSILPATLRKRAQGKKISNKVKWYVFFFSYC